MTHSPAAFRRFQSTLPVRGTTIADAMAYYEGRVSIHASRGEATQVAKSRASIVFGFNPRLPGGEATR